MLNSGSREVQARTSNGRIEFALALEGRVSAHFERAHHGQVKFAPDGRYTFETSNGNIELRIPQDSPGSFQARTSNGHIKFEVGETQLNGRKEAVLQRSDNPEVLLSTSNGNINVIGY